MAYGSSKTNGGSGDKNARKFITAGKALGGGRGKPCNGGTAYKTGGRSGGSLVGGYKKGGR